MVETVHMHTTIPEGGRLTVEVASKLPPGPADVVLVIVPVAAPPPHQVHWRDLYGVGKELWQDEDAQEYVDRLRKEWD